LKCALNHCRENFESVAFSNELRHDHSRIRIGYFSSDFHDHATTQLLAELIERHDRSKFEVLAFSFGRSKADDCRKRLLAGFDQFLDVSAMTDQQIAALARQYEIDIAIDLKGHTQGARTGIFAFRPAPIQVNYLGYPGTSGCSFMDYIIADEIVIPEANKPYFSERVVYLPYSYQCNDSTKIIATRHFTRNELGLPDAGFVFCCFNNSYKITPDVFDVWMRLLTKVDGSVLWLLEPTAHAAKNLRAEAASGGVAPERLVFAPRMALPDHLSRHRQADLFLDTFYCNAHTTASDTLWAGLPIVTCLGANFAGRVAGSLLRAVGLPELITETPAQYEELARRLSADRTLLAEVRNRLLALRNGAPLFDIARYARHFECALITMWRSHQDGLSPSDITVASESE
jgi:protein O-GlcNAc transferase